MYLSTYPQYTQQLGKSPYVVCTASLTCNLTSNRLGHTLYVFAPLTLLEGDDTWSVGTLRID